MLKRSIAFLYCLLIFGSARADYDYMSLPELVCRADYAAVGRIVRIDENYFYLKVDSFLLGHLDKDTLAIVKFESWPCAQRFADYKTGQKEIVFFRKSNDVIDDYELQGYGAGDEFELPIINGSVKYQSAYGELQTYRMPVFLDALKQYARRKDQPADTTSKPGPPPRSELHKLFRECDNKKPKRYPRYDDIPATGAIVDLEKRYLYLNYENKLRLVLSSDTNYSFYVTADSAEVWPEGDYFVVKPGEGWARRFLNVYLTGNDSLLFQQIFEVLELPEPRIYFGNYPFDTVEHQHYHYLLPSTKHYLDDWHYDKNLEYQLLSYDYIIESRGSKETIHCKSAAGTAAFRNRLRQVKAGDRVTVSNAYVLYPDKRVVKLKDRKVYVK